jgi:Flp pilus assembly protein TadG
MPRPAFSASLSTRQRNGIAVRHLRRRGAAAVELAVLLPFLTYMFVGGVDFARVFYYSLTLSNCAREGALYASLDATHAADSTGTQNAALADASGFSPAPTVSSVTSTDSSGNPVVTVTVSYSFKTITSYPGIPSPISLVRTVQMRILPP